MWFVIIKIKICIKPLGQQMLNNLLLPYENVTLGLLFTNIKIFEMRSKSILISRRDKHYSKHILQKPRIQYGLDRNFTRPHVTLELARRSPRQDKIGID